MFFSRRREFYHFYACEINESDFIIIIVFFSKKYLRQFQQLEIFS